ncbi:MAG: iron-containing redox enzyme family protein [Microcystis aeruginosa LG13-03]|jgi:hypothetical protein|nr:iron-containing redox enzyme family protein [Microcystis aeruginosa LG13-13]NCR05876.1 iron-containing redox enzyme family protein [Microcystis aeruginosa LG13-03]NCR64203.1 iron-containing redox enzyme family protein [Microcystis aeruginosa LG11-05]
MRKFSDTFVRPRFRTGVECDVQDSKAILSYRSSSWLLQFDPSFHPTLTAFIQSLYGESSIGSASCPDELTSDSAVELLREFDAMGLITEDKNDVKVPSLLSGGQTSRELQRFMEALKRKYSHSYFFRAMQEENISVTQLIGYAIEYFHIVYSFPTIAGVAMGRTLANSERTILCDYFVSEVHHDRLLAHALNAVGIERSTLERIIPLPLTFAIIASLSAYARQDWTTFRAALWLFEEPSSQFTQHFIRSCKQHGLPKDFYEPIANHASINELEQHGALPQALFKMGSPVPAEAVINAKKNLVALVENLNRMESEILLHYGKNSNLSLRLAE